MSEEFCTLSIPVRFYPQIVEYLSNLLSEDKNIVEEPVFEAWTKNDLLRLKMVGRLTRIL